MAGWVPHGKAKTRQPAEQNNADLCRRAAGEQHDKRGQNREAGAWFVRAERPRYAPDGLRDDGDSGEFQAM